MSSAAATTDVKHATKASAKPAIAAPVPPPTATAAGGGAQNETPPTGPTAPPAAVGAPVANSPTGSSAPNVAITSGETGLRNQDNLCPHPYPPPNTPTQAETPHGTLTVLPATRWQPINGDVQFKLAGMETQPENIVVAFAWQSPPRVKLPGTKIQKPGAEEQWCYTSAPVRLLPSASSDDDKTFTYAARIPALGKDAARPPWLDGLHHRVLDEHGSASGHVRARDSSS